MTQWFHLECAAYKRPEPLLETLGARTEPLPGSEPLETEAKLSVAHRRLPRINGAERAPSGRAQCRSCRETIGKDAWRIPLVYYEESRFQPSGFIHVRCSKAYFETTQVLERFQRFSPGLSEEDLQELRSELGSFES